jgi:poly(hydroxyalkanoate) depolymerase family esterase
MTRTAMRAGSKAMTQALRAAPSARKRTPAKRTPAPETKRSTGVTIGPAGARRYRLYKPPGVRRTERLPLVVMLHGCLQDAEALAASSQMNRIAARERFFVLYPEQDRFSNAQGCWNWYDTRSGRAQGEAGAIDAAIDQVCLLQSVDPDRIALAGFSAGAGMAALLATRRPERFRAIAMHSGIAPGVAHSSATALSAMRGRRAAVAPLAPIAAGAHLPALLVIHGSADHVVAPSNGAEAARRWAARVDAKPSAPRIVQRGARYAATITSYRARGQLVATLCEVNGLGHAWSGGAAGRAYSDPKGPEASRMIWAFMAKQFASCAK